MKDPTPGLSGLFDEATRLASKAILRLLDDPRSQEAMARAVGLAQRSLARVEAAQVELMRSAGIPGRQDFRDLAKQVARVKRKTRDLAARVEAQRAARAGEGAGKADRER
jgi:hypothetical protein